MSYCLVDCLLAQTPARSVDIRIWPDRRSINGVVKYCEWFDWSELFTEGAPEALLRICKEYGSHFVRIACLATDDPSERMTSLRVIEINSDDLSSSYFEAIWDEQSILPFGKLAAIARIVLVWDPEERWLVINDRFLEVGVFVVFTDHHHSLKQNFFEELEEGELLNRFSRIFRMQEEAALRKVERWKRY